MANSPAQGTIYARSDLLKEDGLKVGLTEGFQVSNPKDVSPSCAKAFWDLAERKLSDMPTTRLFSSLETINLACMQVSAQKITELSVAECTLSKPSTLATSVTGMKPQAICTVKKPNSP
jgi:hypothetical protein